MREGEEEEEAAADEEDEDETVAEEEVDDVSCSVAVLRARRNGVDRMAKWGEQSMSVDNKRSNRPQLSSIEVAITYFFFLQNAKRARQL